MPSYHVYFSSKKDISNEVMLNQVHLFMATQIADNFAHSYRVLRMTNKASFESLPDYHLIVDYASQNDLEKGSNVMKTHYKDEPHLSMMKMVSEFKVAFSEDENPTNP